MKFSPKLKNVIITLIFVAVFSSGWIVKGVFNSRSKPSSSPSPSVKIAEQKNINPEKSAEVLAESSQPTSSVSAEIKPTVPSGRQKVKVTRVVDGDTIVIESGEKVRFIGIDTPETVKPNTPVQCFGKEASNKTKELLEGKEVELEKDISETDKYGRLLRYIFLDDVFVNQYLVGEGYAYSSSYPPDIKYQEVFREAQRKAEEENKGLWGTCPVDQRKKVSMVSPSSSTKVFGASTVVQITNAPVEQKSVAPVTTVKASEIAVSSSTTTNSDCKIKGNISSSGKIYHLLGCGSYEKTGINLSQGEKWFCTEDEAVAAGWRKAKNC